jgi:chaperonin GroES
VKINLNELIKEGSINVEQFNIASKLDEEELKKIGETVHNDFKADLESRIDWLQKHTEWKKLYNQTDISTDSPWENSSQESVPVMTEACNSFQARAYKAFFPTRTFLDAIPIGKITPDTLARAERIAKHMSFQLGVLSKNYKRDKNAMFLATALNGSDFTKTYYDPIKRRNIVERVRAVDLVVPYNVGPIQIDEVQRKTHIIRRSLNDAKILKQSGYFIADCEPCQQGYEDDYQQEEDDHQGIKPSGETSLEVVNILEQHTLLDLDEDGIKEPYIVWVDRESKALLRIQIRYEVDEMGQPLNNKEPIEYFEHYKFLENPDGFYGYGIGHLIGKLNTALNKLLRQTIDAGVLANTGTGFVDDKADVKGGEIEIQLGKFIKIANYGERIADAFFQLQFPGPNAGLVTLMQQLENYARSLSSVTDAATGDVEKVYQPVTIMTMLEQSLQMPSSVMEQQAGSFQGELEKLYKLNRKYLDQENYYNENGESFEISKEDYLEDLRVIPIFDPRNITKQQKIAKAQTLFQFILTNPLTAQNTKSLYEASIKMLEAMEIEDIQDILPNPEEQQQPTRIDDQRQENMYFLMPPQDRPLFDVFPDQDHAMHIKIIDELLNGPMGQEIDKEMMVPILDHRKKHVAFLYMNNQLRLEQYGQGPAGIMGQESGDNGSLQALDGAFQAEGAGDALSGAGLEEVAGSMGGAGANPQDYNSTETGFLERLLPENK